MTFALGIPHTPWVPDRVRSFERLRECIRSGDNAPDRIGHYRVFADLEPNWSWSGKLWLWGLETEVDHLIQLQDDVIVDDRFWPNLQAMVSAVPNEIIGLESVHPVSRQIYECGGNWYTTDDGLIGVGYVIPRDVLQEFLEWRSCSLRPGAIEAISEDTLIDVFCMSTGRKVWHPVPTIIDHDTDLPSTYGNDWHTHRKPVVTTVRGDFPPGCDYRVSETPHMGRFYTMTPRMCRRLVKGFTLRDLERVSA